MGANMRRLQMSRLINWIQKEDRKPLVLRGARQVGKSTLVRLFADECKLNLIEINLEQRKSWDKLFQTHNPQVILRELESEFDVDFKLTRSLAKTPTSVKAHSSSQQKNLIFFDECQSAPALLSCLRYFYEEYPEIPVIAAGSLLEFALEKFQQSLPVGRIEFLHLGPMSFEEYLLAIGEDRLIKRLYELELSSHSHSLTQFDHEKALKLQRQYLFVGGMPEAVKKHAAGAHPNEIRKIQSEILNVYRDDFNKYATHGQNPRLHLLLDYGLSHVGEKVKYSKISTDYEAKELRRALRLLQQAKVVTPVYHSPSQGIPIKKDFDPLIFKLLFLDVGLINSGLKLEWHDLIHLPERELLNEGPLAEQFVGQELMAQQDDFELPELFYWLREGKSGSAELDFVMQKGKFLVAIEVKSGASGKMRSLHQWNKDIQYKYKSSLRFDLNLPSIQKIQITQDQQTVKYTLTSLPLYMAGFKPLRFV